MTIAERIEAGVERITETGCWLWLGARAGGIYGAITIRGKQYQTHRVAYETYVGPIPDGRLVCHRCDVRCCVNPYHLFVGTALDNMQDMIAKHRKAVCSGETNGAAKLTAADVLEIRNSTEAQRDIAKRLGVTQSLISLVRTRKIWRHL